MAGDSKIWIAALFMLISFIFNAVKKKRQAEKEALGGQEEESQSNDTSWGVSDLISQFEEKYGVETEPLQNEFTSEEVILDEDYVSEYPREVPKKQPVSTYSEETASHSDLKQEKKKKKSENESYAIKPEFSSSDLELDLRQMVISSTILERPEY